MTSMTRHDIQNLIMVQRWSLKEAKAARNPMECNEALDRSYEMSLQIEQLIAFTRDYQEIGVNEPEWLGVRSLVGDAASHFSNIDVIIDNQVPPSLQVYADRLLEKVFSALIDNAIRHGGNLSFIRFRVEGGKDTLLICEDDGIGIPIDKKEKIFEKGYGKTRGWDWFLDKDEILS